MQTVKVKKVELLSALQKNRESHRSLFLKAQEGYRKAVIDELDGMLDEAKAGKRIRRSVTLIEPIDQTREYDRAIAMLGMSVDDVIELSAEEFNNYVRDEWDWSAKVFGSNTQYVR